jgi:uncharacterized membrane protein
MNNILVFALAAVPAFLASAVEFVEATTIVLAVGITHGWRYPLLGTAAAVAALAALTGIIGVALTTIIPLHLLQTVVGALLLLFGLKWLRKSILRFAGIVALHDEEVIYQREVAELRAQGLSRTGHDWVAFAVAFKSVLLEGLEVAFIVITFGARGAPSMSAAIGGATAAGLLVIGAAVLVRRPLTLVPENWLKFGVGALLCTFGVFWSAEGFGVAWTGDAVMLGPILGCIVLVSWLSVKLLRAILPEGALVAARNV